MKPIFIEFNPQPSLLSRTLYLNLINDKKTVLKDIQSISQQLQNALNDEDIIPVSNNAIPISRATKKAIQERVEELKGKPIPFRTSQLAKCGTDIEMTNALEGLARHMGNAGVQFIKPGLITINAIGHLFYDDNCLITKTEPDLGLKDINALEFLAGICAQDFGLVIERNGALIYLYGSARYEKTPKHVENGFDYFVGCHFLEWHRRIPTWGEPLATLFERLYLTFNQDKLDSLVVDLRGRNLYTDGSIVVRRYERDYALPLHKSNGEILGLIVFADSLFKNVRNETSTNFGGQHLSIQSPAAFNHHFQVIKSATFQHHPFGMRDRNGRLPSEP